MSPTKKRKHDWASIQTFLNAHQRVLNHYAKFMDRHELPDSLEHGLELLIGMEKLALELVDFRGKVPMRIHELPEPHKGPDDGDMCF